jgi:hypothetical protein
MDRLRKNNIGLIPAKKMAEYLRAASLLVKIGRQK